ncbi:MAG: S41 family peptidase, partial [Clostridiales bacterium]|nr:S41 family peptidase [Clostridiales bacterium]
MKEKTKKRLASMIHILICILAISTIPASLFLFDIPDFISILSCMFITVSFLFCLKSGKRKRGGIIALSTISVLSIALTMLGNYCNPYWNTVYMKKNASPYAKPMDTALTRKEAKEDLQYAMHYLKKLHPACYKGTPEELKNRCQEILQEIETLDSISVCELNQKIESLFSILQDGHTCVKAYSENPHYLKDVDKLNQDDKKLAAINGIQLSDLLAILTLDSCTNNDEYRSCLKQLFTEVKDKHIQRVAVDLRSNGGGDSLVADEFIRYLDVDQYNTTSYKWRLGCFQVSSGNHVMENKKQEELLFHGNVYVLTSPNTFSSAMIFAQYITDNNLGTIIGEAPGNTPNGYGEVAGFKLPNSQMYMQISTKEFFRADQNNTERLVEPDIPCSSDKAMDVLYENL